MLKFIVDSQKDAWNWWRIFNSKETIYPKERLSEKNRNFVMTIEGKSFPECYHRLQDFLYEKYLTETRPDLFSIVCVKEWEAVEKKFISILEELTKKEFLFKNEIITTYITTAPLSPYNITEKWLMIFPTKDVEQIKTSIAHELFHFHFQSHYEEQIIRRGLTKNDFHLLKESITFILNEPNFKDIITILDKGYASHKEFRLILKEIWDKEKDFDLFIEKAVEYLLKRGS